MTDNITIPASGVTVGSKDVGGVQVQRVALTVGGSGVANDVPGGAGASTSGTVRTVSASDDPAVVALANLVTAAQVGEVQATPTSNTVLGRLKDVLTGVVLAAGANIVGKVGIDQTTDGTTNLVASKQSGAWNVTNVSGTVSLPTGASTAAKQPALGTAGSASSDVITVQGIASGTPVRGAASTETSVVYNGATALTPKFAPIAASASGANSIVAAVTSKKIRVLAVDLIANGAVNAKWRSATAADLTGLAYLVANAGYVRPFSPTGWFETAAGEALTLDLSAAIAVGGCVVYVEV